MINKFIITGSIRDKFDYTAIYCGNDLSRQTYFYDQNCKDETSIIRFFSKGNEITLKSEGLYHSGSGGTFCEYMFGMNIPFADFIRPSILNRLILWGAYYNDSKNALSFSSTTDGYISYDEIFNAGNSVANWFFFVVLKNELEMPLKQRWILKNLGKHIKTSRNVGFRNENSPYLLADSLIKNFSERDIELFVICLSDRNSRHYRDTFQKILDNPKMTEPYEVMKRENISRIVDQTTALKLKLDTVYRNSTNKKMVDMYKLLLVEAQKFKTIPQPVQNYISRYRAILSSKGIPDEICQILEKRLPVKMISQPVSDYIEEFRLIFYNLLFTELQFNIELSRSDLKVLLLSKHKAFLENNKAFEKVLLDIGKKLDEVKDEELKIRQMDLFSRIVTHFDLYDSCATAITKFAFGQDSAIESTLLISLTGNMETFNNIEAGLFNRLFIDPLFTNRYMTNLGQKKLNSLLFGLEEIIKKSKTISELLDELTSIASEESFYKTITMAARDLGDHRQLPFSNDEERSSLRKKIFEKVSATIKTKFTLPEHLFNRAIQDYNLESVYLNETIPAMILDGNWEQRREFLKTSGLDMARVEEIEKIYCRQHHLDDSYINKIAKKKG
jgi:uncharacterized protein (TIGR04442 family)